MSLKDDISNTFFAFNELNLHYQANGSVDDEKLHRVEKMLTDLKKHYSDDEADLDILTVLSKKQKAKKLKSDQFPNDVYWYLNKKGAFTLSELAALVGVTQEAIRGRVQRGEPPASHQTVVGRRVAEGEEVDPEEISGDSMQSLLKLRDQKGLSAHDRIDLEKEINRRSSETLSKQTLEKKKQLDNMISWITQVLIESVNRLNREALRDAVKQIKEKGEAERVLVDIRPLFKRALEDGIFRNPAS